MSTTHDVARDPRGWLLRQIELIRRAEGPSSAGYRGRELAAALSRGLLAGLEHEARRGLVLARSRGGAVRLA